MARKHIEPFVDTTVPFKKNDPSGLRQGHALQDVEHR